MNQTERPLGGYEERLLGELRALVEERAADDAAVQPSIHGRAGGPWRPGAPSWRPALGGVAAAAAAATGVMVFAGGDGARAAYAVEPHPDGSITVEIRELRDAAGLESKLRAAGVPAEVDYLPMGKACREPRSRQPTRGPSNGGLATREDGSVVFTLDRNSVRPGQTLLVTTQGDRSLGSIGMSIAEGPVEPCVPVDAPAEPASPEGSSPNGGKSATGGQPAQPATRGPEAGAKRSGD